MDIQKQVRLAPRLNISMLRKDCLPSILNYHNHHRHSQQTIADSTEEVRQFVWNERSPELRQWRRPSRSHITLGLQQEWQRLWFSNQFLSKALCTSELAADLHLLCCHEQISKQLFFQSVEVLVFYIQVITCILRLSNLKIYLYQRLQSNSDHY